MPRDAAGRALLLGRIAASVFADPAERQAMLEADGLRRLALVQRQITLAGSLLTALERTPRPEDPGRN
jgi:hypothetical protein